MKFALTSFTRSLKMLFKDKVLFVFFSLPILIGVILYYFLGSAIYDFGMNQGKGLIQNYIENSTASVFLTYTVQIILYIVLFFIINWTFVLIISVIASPFNDMISSRIEKIINGQPLPSLGPAFNSIFKDIFFTIFNEIRKLSVIFLVTIFALVLNFIPLLTPISLFLTVLLVAVAYLDYSWSRHNMILKACLKDVSGNFLTYAVGGAFFFFLISIPVLNLLVPSWATSYFTMVWVKNNAHRNQITG